MAEVPVAAAAAAAASEPPAPKTKEQMAGTVCIYSPYINKNKTIQEGRRISKEKACDDPTAWEIMSVCQHIFGPENVEGENKGYSRDYEAQWQPMRGRIRVKLFKDDKPILPDVTNRKQLFCKVASLVPKIASRQPGFQEAQQKAYLEATGQAGGKKKNKKK